ncbi:MAG: T9SS type A sorting domain-containing protein [Flavobacteriaceae bacterium]|nr:T9SS type A sorting domain-containing protein [Flavobacteriaceae bacterium]
MKKILPIILLFLSYNISTAQLAGNAAAKGLIETTFSNPTSAADGTSFEYGGDLTYTYNSATTPHIYWAEFQNGSAGITIDFDSSKSKTSDGSGSIKVTKSGSAAGGIMTKRGSGQNSNLLDSNMVLNLITGNSPLQSADDVTLSFSIYSENGSAIANCVRGAIRDGTSGDKWDRSGWQTVNAQSGWTTISVNLGVNAGQDFSTISNGLRFTIDLHGNITGTFWIDDITVTGIDTKWDGSGSDKISNRYNYGVANTAAFIPSQYEDLVIPKDLTTNYPDLKETSFIINNLRIEGDSDTSTDSDGDGTNDNDGRFTIQHSEGNNSDGVSGNENYPRLLQVNGNLLVDNGGVLTINRGSEIHVKGDFTDSNTSGGNIIFQSDSDQFSALKADGSAPGARMVYNMFVNGDAVHATDTNQNWDLKGSPLSPGTLNASNLASGNISGVTNYALFEWNTGSDIWGSNTVGGNTTINDPSASPSTNGKGYAMAQNSNLGAGGVIYIYGGIETSSTVSYTMANAGDDVGHWNLLANPYSAYLALNGNAQSDVGAGTNLWQKNVGANDVLGNITDQKGFYVWNGSSGYTTITQAGTNFLAPGQGFFVSAKSDNAVFEFTEGMRTTISAMSSPTTDDAISGDAIEENEGELFLDLEQNSFKGFTRLFFIENMSDEFDVDYDGLKFPTENIIDLYSKLVEGDQTQRLDVQCLSYFEMWNKIIPLGINALANEEMTVSISHRTTPADLNIYLEDAVEGTMTDLNAGDFVLTPTDELSGAGRFFIHMTADTMSNEDVSTSMLNAYKQVNANYITIEGLATQSNNINVSLYNILGTKVLDTSLSNSANTQTLSTVGMASGIYVIELESGNDRLTKKLIIQ